MILNSFNKKIEFAQAFDTYISSVEIEELINHEFPEGMIIIVACQDECVKNMSDSVKNWFEKMGSKLI